MAGQPTSHPRTTPARAHPNPPTHPATPGPGLPAPTRTSLHPVGAAGHFGWSRYSIGVGTAHAGQTVLVAANGLDLTIWGQPGLIHRVTVDPNRTYQPTGKPVGRPPRSRP